MIIFYIFKKKKVLYKLKVQKIFSTINHIIGFMSIIKLHNIFLNLNKYKKKLKKKNSDTTFMSVNYLLMLFDKYIICFIMNISKINY